MREISFPGSLHMDEVHALGGNKRVCKIWIKNSKQLILIMYGGNQGPLRSWWARAVGCETHGPQAAQAKFV